jgi:1-acyl-sn-glycerol-3-phosphate acyltransferase
MLQFFFQLLCTFWLRLRVYGREHLEGVDGALLLINHQSYLDPMIVGVGLKRPVSFLARDSLYKVPLIGWVLNHTYVLPINRDAANTASIRACIKRLEEGYLVGLFPEGTRSSDGQLGEIKPGFVAIIRRAKVPVIPVAVEGCYEAFPKGAWFIRPHKIRVVFGKPIPAADIERLTQKGQEAAMAERIHQELSQYISQAKKLQ